MSEGVISAKVIQRSRVTRYCVAVWCGATIPPGVLHVRLYGCGFEGDPKYTVRMCEDCARRSPNPKVQAALSRLDPQGKEEIR